MPAPKTAEEFVDMPAEDIRSYLESGQQPPELSDAQISQLPPSTLESYIIARETAGDTGIFERIKAFLTAGVEADKLSEQQRREMQSYDVEYRDGVPASENNYRAIDHQRLKAAVEPITAEGITVYSDGYHNLHKLLQELSDKLKESIGKSKQGWEGGAADNAHGYFTGLSTWAEGNSQNARMASTVVHQESEAASRAKYSMPEPIPFSMSEEMKNWGSDPFTITEKISATIEKQRRSQEAHDEAARVMSQYDADLHQAGNKQPVFTEPPTFGGGDGGSGDSMPSNVISIPGDGSTSASGFAGGPAGTAGGASFSPGGGSFSPGGGGTVPSGGGYSPPAPLPSGPGTGSGPVPGGTNPSGFQPGGPRPRPSVPTGRNNTGGNTGFGGMGAMPVGGMAAGGFGPGGGGDYSGKLGRGVGGFGPGGGAGAAGPGAGAASGATPGARPGAVPGAAGAAAAGGAGAASAAGRGAMPMGAAGGRGGQGGEDDEHQRPTYLVEADPDEVFGTDQRTAPPVIGE